MSTTAQLVLIALAAVLAPILAELSGRLAVPSVVIELVFGKQELMSLCQGAGLRLEREWTSIPYDVSAVTGHRSSTRTYLFAL